jgi:hypothetical protein
MSGLTYLTLVCGLLYSVRVLLKTRNFAHNCTELCWTDFTYLTL